LGLAKVGIKKYQSSNLVQKLIESTNVQPSTKAPLLPNPCYRLPFSSWSSIFFLFESNYNFMESEVVKPKFEFVEVLFFVKILSFDLYNFPSVRQRTLSVIWLSKFNDAPNVLKPLLVFVAIII
jgi:hypothetical protein